MKKNISLLLLLTMIIFSCKKTEDDIQWIEPVEEDIECPCNPDSNCIYKNGTMLFFDQDRINSTSPYWGEYQIQGVNYYGSYSERHLDFYFGSEPQTGKYTTINMLDANEGIYDGEVYVQADLQPTMWGYFYYTPEDDFVYVKNENGYISLSFCDMQFTANWAPEIEHFITSGNLVARIPGGGK